MPRTITHRAFSGNAASENHEPPLVVFVAPRLPSDGNVILETRGTEKRTSREYYRVLFRRLHTIAMIHVLSSARAG